MKDGTMTFGSRWEGGVLRPSTGAKPGHWWERVKDGEIPLDHIRGTLSRIYAFDHFINNPDRHCNNFIVREQHEGYAVLANDYSRAWMCCGFPLPLLPMTASTVSSQRFLSSFWEVKYIDPAEANILLEKIKSVPKSYLDNIISWHPQDWLTKAQEEMISDWWGSKPMTDRVEGIAKGIADGSYL
jgi:hypothetical protein